MSLSSLTISERGCAGRNTVADGPILVAASLAPRAMQTMTTTPISIPLWKDTKQKKNNGTFPNKTFALQFLLSSVCWRKLKCCFMSTETVGLVGTGAQDDHLDIHTAPEL